MLLIYTTGCEKMITIYVLVLEFIDQIYTFKGLSRRLRRLSVTIYTVSYTVYS